MTKEKMILQDKAKQLIKGQLRAYFNWYLQFIESGEEELMEYAREAREKYMGSCELYRVLFGKEFEIPYKEHDELMAEVLGEEIEEQGA